MSGTNAYLVSRDAEGAPLMDPQYASLAKEIAQDIRPIGDILPDYGFSGAADPEWIALLNSRPFKQLLESSIREWNAADSTLKRIRHKAQASLEILIAEMHAIAMSDGVAIGHRTEMMKLIKSAAGVDAANANAQDQGGGFSFTINLGTAGGPTLSTTLRPPLNRNVDVTLGAPLESYDIEGEAREVNGGSV